MEAVAAAAGVEFSDCAFGFFGFAGFFFSCFAGFSFSFAPSLAANDKTNNHYSYDKLGKKPRLSQSSNDIPLQVQYRLELRCLELGYLGAAILN